MILRAYQERSRLWGSSSTLGRRTRQIVASVRLPAPGRARSSERFIEPLR